MRIISFFAYLDPGTGSVIIQSLIGIAAGVGVFGRRVFSGLGHKVKDVFSGSKSADKKSTSEKS